MGCVICNCTVQAAIPLHQSICYSLGSSLMSEGLTVQTLAPPDEQIAVVNLSGTFGCRSLCPISGNELDPYFQQACNYVIRVEEVFKGGFTVNQEITSPGPDVLTTCGNPSRLLQIGTRYVVGIGGPCSPIVEWAALSSFGAEEMRLLRSLGPSMNTTTGMETTVSTPSNVSVTHMSLPTSTSSAVSVKNTIILLYCMLLVLPFLLSTV